MGMFYMIYEEGKEKIDQANYTYLLVFECLLGSYKPDSNSLRVLTVGYADSTVYNCKYPPHLILRLTRMCK